MTLARSFVAVALYSLTAFFACSSCQAAVTYQFQSSVDGSVIGELQISDTIASATSPWLTLTPTHIENLLLDRSVFPVSLPGTGLVSLGTPDSVPAPLQSDGPTITAGRVVWNNPLPGITEIQLFGDGNVGGNPPISDLDLVTISGVDIGANVRGNFVTAIPEPHSAALLASLTLVGLTRVRRFKRLQKSTA